MGFLVSFDNRLKLSLVYSTCRIEFLGLVIFSCGKDKQIIQHAGWFWESFEQWLLISFLEILFIYKLFIIFAHMNREIKFRYYYYTDNKMYNVLSVSGRFGDEDFNRVFIARESLPNEPTNLRADSVNGVLMQFTGLKDKNENNIFEGDIIRGHRKKIHYKKVIGRTEMIFEVRWNHERLWFEIYYPQMNWSNPLANLLDAPYEVIGNIYEHSYLLKANESI